LNCQYKKPYFHSKHTLQFPLDMPVNRYLTPHNRRTLMFPMLLVLIELS
jgi:hypothetical protein